MDPHNITSAGLLEWELSLSSDQIISHGWYHGSIRRIVAEGLLTQDRQFLVRDSSTQPQNYVLSCRSSGQHLHFVIQRVMVNVETMYERYQYQFEDEAYDTVADLITSYVGSGKPISAASGARIQYPANRNKPLTSFIAVEQPNDLSMSSPLLSGNHSFATVNYNVYNHFSQKPTQNIILRLPFKKQRSHSLTPIDIHAHIQHGKSASADGVIQGQSQAEKQPIKQMSCDSTTSSSTWESNLPSSPPAKPARNETLKTEEHGRRFDVQQRLYHVSGSDSGNGSGDSNQSSVALDPAPKARVEAEYAISTPNVKQELDYEKAEKMLLEELTEYIPETRINFDSYQTQLIPGGQTKPLSSEVLHIIKLLIHSAGPRILANHMTSIDMKFLFGETKHIPGLDRQISGLEMCFLPHGQQVRRDIIERVETFKLLIGVTILTCQTDRKRAETINDWITLAIETKTALGNLFGFSTIMLGLCMPQIECLDSAWAILRRVYTDNAFMFEAKLRPCFKSMNEGTNPLPPNTTTPHILPAILCFHSIDADKEKLFTETDYVPANSLEFDFASCAAHMEAARQYPYQVETFKRNAKTVVQELSSLGAMMDPGLLELFRTEFHMKFLWGDRVRVTSPGPRFSRLSEILSSMSQKYASRPEETEPVPT